jgi:hypothetical protein
LGEADALGQFVGAHLALCQHNVYVDDNHCILLFDSGLRDTGHETNFVPRLASRSLVSDG